LKTRDSEVHGQLKRLLPYFLDRIWKLSYTLLSLLTVLASIFRKYVSTIESRMG
jgi:hypothetical protein